MELENRLSRRIGMHDIHEICFLSEGDEAMKHELYSLLYGGNIRIAVNAAWILTHFNVTELQWLSGKQDEMINETIRCKDSSKRRLLLVLLYRQPVCENPPRVDFLDFCLQRMISKDEPLGIRSICMKMAYELCLGIPELLDELKLMLDMMEPDLLSPALLSARRNVLKAMKKGRSLR